MKKLVQLLLIVLLAISPFRVPTGVAATTCTNTDFKCELTPNGQGIVLKGFVGSPTSTSLVIPKQLTVHTVTGEQTLDVIEIGDVSFNDSELTDVTFPDTLQKIGMYAFSTNKLTTLEIPASVIQIRDNAFMANHLESVKFLGTGSLELFPQSFAKQEKPGRFFSGWFEDQSYTVPVDLTTTITKSNQIVYAGWPTSSIEGDFEVVEVGGTITITNYIGTNANVVIPDMLNNLTVTAIAPRAFKEKGIEEVIIPDTVTSIGEEAFYNSGLQRVTLPTADVTFGNYAFASNELTELILPEGVKRTGTQTFRNNRLTSVTFPSSLQSIDDMAFSNNLLETIQIPSNVRDIGMYAFSDNQLKNLVIPSNIAEIRGYAFSRNPLDTVQFYGTTELRENVFYDLIKHEHDFNDWYTDQNETNGWVSANNAQQVSPATYYADWTINQYTLTFETNGGVALLNGGAVTVQVLDYNTLATEPGSISKNGYDFDGWYKDSSFTTAWDFMQDLVTSDTTIYAKWLATVSFDSADGSSVADVHVVENGTLTKPQDPVRTGYVFAGWYKDATYTAVWDFATDKVVGNTTLYAKWDIAQYTVSFDSTGGSTVADVSAAHDSVLTAPQAPTKAGYVFAGWYKDAAHTDEWNFTTEKVVGNTTLYAKWDIAQYTVSFDSNAGSAVADMPAAHDSILTAPQAPTKAGYVFVGWYKDAAHAAEWNFATDKVVGNTTLYAKWEIAQYTVSFNSKGGSAVADMPAAHDSILTVPQAPTKAGYVFAGWYKDAVFTDDWNFTTEKVVGNMTLYAKWHVQQSSGGSDRDDDDDDSGEVTEPSTPIIIPVQPLPQPQPNSDDETAGNETPEETPTPQEVQPNSCPEHSFIDIQGHVAQETIEAFTEQGYIIGYADCTIRPDDLMKRRQVATVLTRMFELERSTTLIPFKDISPAHPAYAQITLLQQAGIFDGANGYFNEQEPITQAQFAKIVVRLFGLTSGGTIQFEDVSPTHWSYPYAAALVELGIMDAPNSKFEPNKAMTRAEFIVLLTRVIEIIDK